MSYRLKGRHGTLVLNLELAPLEGSLHRDRHRHQHHESEKQNR